MKCNLRTGLYYGLILLGLLTIAYMALPEFQQFILKIGPALLFLACPISMFFMMKSMEPKSSETAVEPSDKTNHIKS